MSEGKYRWKVRNILCAAVTSYDAPYNRTAMNSLVVAFRSLCLTCSLVLHKQRASLTLSVALTGSALQTPPTQGPPVAQQRACAVADGEVDPITGRAFADMTGGDKDSAQGERTRRTEAWPILSFMQPAKTGLRVSVGADLDAGGRF